MAPPVSSRRALTGVATGCLPESRRRSAVSGHLLGKRGRAGREAAQLAQGSGAHPDKLQSPPNSHPLTKEQYTQSSHAEAQEPEVGVASLAKSDAAREAGSRHLEYGFQTRASPSWLIVRKRGAKLLPGCLGESGCSEYVFLVLGTTLWKSRPLRRNRSELSPHSLVSPSHSH